MAAAAWWMLLLPVLRLSGALPAHWLPGEYANSSSDALRFLSDYNSTAEEVFSFAVSASWNFNTNLTDHNSKLQVNASLELEAFSEAWGLKAKTVFTPKIIDSLPDPKDQMLIRGIMMLGFANLPEDEREEVNTILSTMSRIYATAKVHPQPDVSWSLDRELKEIMAKSRSYQKLLFVWEAWRNAAGAPQKKLYSRFVELSNKAARADGFADTGAVWRSWYESET
ncbi:angiotensin-converting enzyme-like, partial [Oryzias melastigma]|uniref:angiotensin-converting enzyme-like n=1 Tax=Oryzias melastigma TaxID=30732 RepID=UPI00168D65D8